MYLYQVCGAAMQAEWRAEEERRAAQELEEVKQQRRLMEFKVQDLSYFVGSRSYCQHPVQMHIFLADGGQDLALVFYVALGRVSLHLPRVVAGAGFK